MDRRTFLRAGAAVSLGALAGCGGGESDPLVVASKEFTIDDHLVVTASVVNVGDARHTGTLVVTPTIDGAARPRRRDVALDPHAVESYRFDYEDVGPNDFKNLSLDVAIENVE